MAIEFTNKPIKWTNEGTAPSSDLKTNGFQAGYKPPAAVFNNQWHTTGECIEELQTKLSDTDDKKVDKVEGKSLIDESVANNISYAGNSGLTLCRWSFNAAEMTHTSPLGGTEDLKFAIDSGLTLKTTGDSGDFDIILVKGSKTHKLSEKLSTTCIAEGEATGTIKIGRTGSQTAEGPFSTIMGFSGHTSNDALGSVAIGNAECLAAYTVAMGHTVASGENQLVFGKYNVKDTENKYACIIGNGTDSSDAKRSNAYTIDWNGNAWFAGEVEGVKNGTTHKLSEKANEASVTNRFDALPIKSLAGQTVKPTSDTSVTAAEGATIIGDLRNRNFAVSSGAASQGNVASGKYATAMGAYTTASGNNSLAGGQGSIASNNNAIAIGYHVTASNSSSVAFGHNNRADGFTSFAIGSANITSGSTSVAAGTGNTALDYQFKIGCYSKAGTAGGGGTTGDAFTIGNGTFSNLSNAFRVTYAGKAYGLSAYGSSGADYAEYFEWKDGNPDNEDRRGRLVTLDGEKIRFATSEDDYILGIVSANPCVEGDIQPDDWQGKYLTDVFGQRLTQTVHIPARYEEQEITDPETGETTTESVLIEDEHDAVQWVLNPDYDPEQEYISREDRKEWTSIGLMGKLVVIDDGTCEVNGYCKAGVNGIATKADDGYRVMARIDDTHIRVLVR